MIKEKLENKLKEVLNKINNASYNDKQEMDNLVFEREKIMFSLEVLKEYDKLVARWK